ncbi:MAG: hypothetical protein ABH842_02565 [Candidatus Micrarchaeota archaeon]
MEINRAFRSTTKILLGQELGPVEEYHGFLSRYIDLPVETKSILSGKPVYLAAETKKKIISNEEMSKLSLPSVSINEIKDIDSLFHAVQENFHHAGNKIGGQFKEINRSDECYDVYFINNCLNVYETQYASNCQMMKDTKYVFGCAWGVENTFGINTNEFYKVSRVFESTMVLHSNDVYYSYNCRNCHDVMFCMNQRSKRNAIGNNELSKEKYFELKKKLLSEICDLLIRKKTAPGHMDLFQGVNE